jgi:hypothetical protein
MKRLDQELYENGMDAWMTRYQSEPWRRQVEWWRQLGLDEHRMKTLLRKAGAERMKFEEELLLAEPMNDRGREVKRLLDESAPLIEFLKTERLSRLIPIGKVERQRRNVLFFGKLGRRLEVAIKRYRKWYLERYSLSAKRAAHRPGEPWLSPVVLELDDVFRGYKLSAQRPKKAIYDALIAAGHGDVVTRDKIRNILREANRGTDLGRTPTPSDDLT